MKAISIMTVVLVILFLGRFSLNAEEVSKGKKLKPQSTCPVMKGTAITSSEKLMGQQASQ